MKQPTDPTRPDHLHCTHSTDGGGDAGRRHTTGALPKRSERSLNPAETVALFWSQFMLTDVVYNTTNTDDVAHLVGLTRWMPCKGALALALAL